MAKGGRGNKNISVMGGGKVSAPETSPALEKTLNKLIKQTANLKKEQYRIIDDEGNVLLKKQGEKDHVIATVGEKRQYLDGATSLHNHPDDNFGGTFSDADVKDFGYGAKQMVIAAPEGTYRLKNAMWGTANQSEGWLPMQEEMKKISESQSHVLNMRKAKEYMATSKVGKEMKKVSDTWVKRKDAGASQAELNKLVDKYNKLETEYRAQRKAYERKLEVQPYHDFLKKNAKKYGFIYEYPKAAD